MRAILFGGGLALLFSLLGTRVAINLFTKWGYGQEIRDDGPTSHHTKRGTPTMGGVVIILATLIGYFGANLITRTVPSASALLLLFLFVGMGAVGFLDDYIKIVKQRSLGLRSKAKIIGQAIVALIFGVLTLSGWLKDGDGLTPASEKISFLRELDWLATGACVMVFGAYMLVIIWQNNQACGSSDVGNLCYNVRDPLDLAVVAAAITGACFGFLW